MDAIVTRLEGLVARVAGGGDDGEGTPVSVSEYDAYYKASVQPFVDACNARDETKKLGADTEKAFKHAAVIVEAATQCKKPEQAEMMTFLGPVVEVITAAQSAPGNEGKAIGEAIQCLNWLLSEGPKSTVTGAAEGADFWLNKILMGAKNKEDPAKTQERDFVKTLKAMLGNLATYCNDFHKTGIMWKFSGGPLKDFTPGQKAAGGGDVSVESRLEGLCAAMESHIQKTQGNEEDGPMCVSQFNAFYAADVVPFIAACNKFPELAKIAAWTEKAMTHCGVVILATTQCKKPAGDAFMGLLGPIVTVITEAGNPRKSDTFNQETTFSEAVQALNFLCMEGAPKGYIMGQVEAGSFFSNKVLTAAKDMADPDKTNHREWVKTLKQMLTGLAEYAHDNFKMGLVWKVKDAIDVKDFKP